MKEDNTYEYNYGIDCREENQEIDWGYEIYYQEKWKTAEDKNKQIISKFPNHVFNRNRSTEDQEYK